MATLRSLEPIRRSWRRFGGVFAAISVFALTACAKTTVVVLVRHAEPASTPGDPGLDPAGVARAQELVNVLTGTNLAAVFHTQLNRSRQTADPVATSLSLTRIEVPLATGQEQVNADSIATHIKSTFAGNNVLVVGHSTTLHLIQAALGVTTPLIVPPTEFNNLLVVVRRGSDVPARIIHARFGQ